MKHLNNNSWDASQINMIQGFSTRVNLMDLRLDITEWIESVSVEGMTSSCFIITVIQRPGAKEQQILPQEYRSLAAACMDGSKTLVEILTDFGARSITTDIRNNRFVVTASNGVMITMVLE